MKALHSVMLIPFLASFAGCIETGGTTDADGGDEPDGSDLDEVVARHSDHANRLPNNVPVFNAHGITTTVSTQGSIDLNNDFFQDLGKNGRRCVSCHVPTSGWTITPRQLQTVFNATDGGVFDDGLGLAAVFRTVDGSNSPRADVSTLAKRRAAYSLLLKRGLIRIDLAVPANAEFELVAVDDPYKFASAAHMSLFRRPLPIANLKFDSTVMWDGRETAPGLTVRASFENQSSNAVMVHAEGQPLPLAVRKSIVDFQLGLAAAQIVDRKAGDLRAAGAKGGPDAIHKQVFYIGINDNFGDPVTGKPFTPIVFDIYDRWNNIGNRRDARGHDGHGHGHDDDDNCDKFGINASRRAIARGQAIFNTHPINIAGVSGINDEAVFGKPANLVGTCTTCHDAPNAGNHSVVAPLNIGLADASRRTPDMPLYTFRNKTTREIVKVTDPGRALISGKWAHIGRFKGPMLRNLAVRAPYFHNGFAADFDAVIDFYEDRFNIGLTKQERSDLIAFLKAL